MSSTSDALLILRQAVKSNEPVSFSNKDGPCTSLLNATHLVISGTSLPKSSPTRYRKPGAAPSDFYSIEAIYLAWLLRDAPGAEYMKQAREHGLAVGFVSVTERKSVVDWLEDKISGHERIAPLSGVSSSSLTGASSDVISSGALWYSSRHTSTADGSRFANYTSK